MTLTPGTVFAALLHHPVLARQGISLFDRLRIEGYHCLSRAGEVMQHVRLDESGGLRLTLDTDGLDKSESLSIHDELRKECRPIVLPGRQVPWVLHSAGCLLEDHRIIEIRMHLRQEHR